jgi:flagellar basal body-associated protein FliL
MNELLPLAASGSPSLFLIVVGVVLVLMILGAFWWGSRRAARRQSPGPSGPTAQPPTAASREASWDTPDDDTGRQHR